MRRSAFFFGGARRLRRPHARSFSDIRTPSGKSALRRPFSFLTNAVPLLVAFLPMLMDTGGNCGSQSATLVIRGLALGEIRTRDLPRVVRKELAVSVIVSGVLAAANGLRIFLQYRDGAIALVISLSLAATVVLAKLVGCVLPIAAKRLRMDPAIMASPLITTIVDAGAVLIYFRTAAALLRLTV